MFTKFLDLCSKYRSSIIVAALIVCSWNLLQAQVQIHRIEVSLYKTAVHVSAIETKLNLK